MHKSHILVELLLRLLRHTCFGQRTFVLLLGYLGELGVLAGFRLQLLKGVYDVVKGIIVSSSVDPLVEYLVSMGKYPLDEFARVANSVEQWNRGISGCRHSKSPVVVWWSLAEARAGDVRHEEAGKKECGWYVTVANILFDRRFGVEVVDVRKFATRDCGHVQEGRPDEVLHAAFLLACQNLSNYSFDRMGRNRCSLSQDQRYSFPD